MRRLPLSAALLGVIVLAVTGCGITDPYQHATPRTTTKAGTTATTSSLAASAPTDGAGPRLALARYAWLAINWTSRTLAADQDQLAGFSTGGARAQALQTAATYGTHSALQHSQVANRGQITSIAAGIGPRRGAWVITTEETSSGQGDYAGLPAQAHIYIAQLTHTQSGWRVSQWSPQN